jgi:hypothetical protein
MNVINLIPAMTVLCQSGVCQLSVHSTTLAPAFHTRTPIYCVHVKLAIVATDLGKHTNFLPTVGIFSVDGESMIEPFPFLTLRALFLIIRQKRPTKILLPDEQGHSFELGMDGNDTVSKC